MQGTPKEKQWLQMQWLSTALAVQLGPKGAVLMSSTTRFQHI